MSNRNLLLEDQLFTLPSMGRVYDTIELIGEGDVRLRSIIAADQKRMATTANNPYRMYQQFLSRHILEPENLVIDNLLLSDAVAILFGVYVVSHGSDFSIKFRCEYCSTADEKIVDMMDLDVIYADDKIDEGCPLKMNNTVLLEGKKEIVTFHLPIVKDERIAKQGFDSAKKRGKEMTAQNLDLDFYRMATYIDDISPAEKMKTETETEGDNPKPKLILEEKEEYLEKLSMRDYHSYRDAVVDADTGLKTSLEVACGGCGANNDVDIMLGPNFFRPPKRRSK